MTAISVDTQVPADRHLLVRLPDAFPAGPVRVTVEAIDAIDADEAPAPGLSPLGQRLLELRRQAIAGGMTLLTQDEVLEEARRRAGEPLDED